MKSIEVGCGKMGYIAKTSSIYRKPAYKTEGEAVNKESNKGCAWVPYGH
jgi:hypothetical protein